ncbi:lipoate--protein ligase [Alkalispirochaeta sphaeroplastigenens]|uniref:lipoate--protein ligase n=1 Tax=Alkalispirochaeta sphaeroplastigenens TaxID=1187066 RepID=UPI000CDB9915|nr:lipoate--protein ligase [Alkalispirochaeta sphaeroplastigenens]
MRPDVRVFHSTSGDPWFNLALEEWIFRTNPPERQTLFLWRNDPSVVIGRYQNPWVECNLPAMNAAGVHLVRRQSGGGTVYHDRGNTNFTFISPADSYQQDHNFRILVNALAWFGLQAYRSERNDLLVSTDGGKRKVSGNAFKHTRERCFHHGTLLIRADLDRLQEYLRPSERPLRARGTRSVSSPVANLGDLCKTISHDSLGVALREAFAAFYGGACSEETLHQEDLAALPEVENYYRKMRSWEWRYGATPEFVLEVPLAQLGGHIPENGQGRAEVVIDEGRIRDIMVHCSDPGRFRKEAFLGMPWDEIMSGQEDQKIKG